MAAGLLICLLAACNNEPLDPTGGPNDNYLEISFSRTTRADLDGNGAGNFSEGDRVGLYIDNGSETRYRELTYTSGEWQPRLRRSEFGEGELILAAHYPVLPERRPIRHAPPSRLQTTRAPKALQPRTCSSPDRASRPTATAPR